MRLDIFLKKLAIISRWGRRRWRIVANNVLNRTLNLTGLTKISLILRWRRRSQHRDCNLIKYLEQYNYFDLGIGIDLHIYYVEMNFYF